jgi:pyruvate formate lyase activating enzyme
MTQGIIFDIQSYSLHDGPGIRTLVFLKGCPLRCIWCQNPESQRHRPELLYDTEKCTGCGTCVTACRNGAIEVREGKSHTDRERCDGCGECVNICPTEARILAGRTMSAEEVFREVKKDEAFFRNSGGGVTLSGGEPLAQPEFSSDVLRLCREQGIATAIETCGLAPWEAVAQVLRYTDLVLYDLKHLDAVAHRKLTGAPNEVILKNARRIHGELGIPIIARIPVVPGCNADLENIEATARFIAHELGTETPVNLLAYHRLGESKYARLEQTGSGAFIAPPSEEEMEELKRLMEERGLSVTIGG